jgi:hypothetical protein
MRGEKASILIHAITMIARQHGTTEAASYESRKKHHDLFFSVNRLKLQRLFA